MRKVPSMSGFHTWVGAAAKRVSWSRARRHGRMVVAVQPEVDQHPTVRVRFSTGTA